MGRAAMTQVLNDVGGMISGLRKCMWQALRVQAWAATSVLYNNYMQYVVSLSPARRLKRFNHCTGMFQSTFLGQGLAAEWVSQKLAALGFKTLRP